MSQTISIATLRNNLADALNTVNSKKDYLLITKRGNPVSAIINLDLFEDFLALTSKKYLQSIKKARDEAKRGEVYSHDEVFGDL